MGIHFLRLYDVGTLGASYDVYSYFLTLRKTIKGNTSRQYPESEGRGYRTFGHRRRLWPPSGSCQHLANLCHQRPVFVEGHGLFHHAVENKVELLGFDALPA